MYVVHVRMYYICSACMYVVKCCCSLLLRTCIVFTLYDRPNCSRLLAQCMLADCPEGTGNTRSGWSSWFRGAKGVDSSSAIRLSKPATRKPSRSHRRIESWNCRGRPVHLLLVGYAQMTADDLMHFPSMHACASSHYCGGLTHLQKHLHGPTAMQGEAPCQQGIIPCDLNLRLNSECSE